MDSRTEIRRTPFGWMASENGELFGPFSTKDELVAAREKGATIAEKLSSSLGSGVRRSRKLRPCEKIRERDSREAYESHQAKLKIMWDAIN